MSIIGRRAWYLTACIIGATSFWSCNDEDKGDITDDKAENGTACTQNSDCKSDYCGTDGKCAAKQTTDEKAENGAACAQNSDCKSDYCGTDSKCAAKQTTDEKAENGAACTQNSDCKSDYCGTDSKCAAKQTTDEKAENGAACTQNSDCKSDYCGTDSKCAAKQTTDEKAENGAACTQNSDCKSDYCGTDNKCAAKQTTDEKGKIGDDCSSNADCESDYCGTDNTCAAKPTTDPKKANGDDCSSNDDCESDYCGTDNTCAAKPTTDPKKANGADCSSNDDCESDYCGTDNTCAAKPTTDPKKANGADCSSNDDCESDYCGTDNTCAAKPTTDPKKANGDDCSSNDDCESDYCGTDNTCAAKPTTDPKKANGDDCSSNDDCESDYCGTDGKCAESGAETACKMTVRSCGNLSNWTYGSSQSFADQGLTEIAAALDMCMNKISATDEAKEGGIIEISVTRSGMTQQPDARQVNILAAMKDSTDTPLIFPREGGSFVLLSTGLATDAKGLPRTNGKLNGEPVFDAEQVPHVIPEPYKTAHSGNLKAHASCDPAENAKIFDSVRLHIKMRAPETAKGFSFDFRFFARDWPYYVCDKSNDYFLALLTDEDGNPLPGVNEDGNIAFEETNNQNFKRNPITVNSAFITTCANPACGNNFTSAWTTGCPYSLGMSCDPTAQTCGTGCTDGSAELAAYYPDYFSAKDDNAPKKKGGGTAWLTTQAPVKPGEIFNLDFYIWDTDSIYEDSTVILDNFQWICGETAVKTDFAKAAAGAN